MQSSSRNGARVHLLAVHTTEGIAKARDLISFFNRKDASGSSHASADNTGELLGPEAGYVPYDRAAWTLRNGNPVSDNLEYCGWARYSREQWLTTETRGLEAIARWLADRSKARGIPLVKLSPADVKAGKSGVIGHNDWTVGMNDGSHWDPGPGFPWDIVMARAQQLARGGQPIIGAIRNAYDRAGWAMRLGDAKGPEVVTADQIGRWQEFANGGIYWQPNVVDADGHSSVAHIVIGEIFQKYVQRGAEVVLGWPITDELPTPDGSGRFNHFTGSGPTGDMPTSIYWHTWCGAHVMQGRIRERWAAMGWETGLGYPVTDELPSPDGVGRFQHFSGRTDGKQTSIYWTPETGAWDVHGWFRDAWAASGWELGPWGYPVSSEYPAMDGVLAQNFQHGRVAIVDGAVVFEPQ